MPADPGTQLTKLGWSDEIRARLAPWLNSLGPGPAAQPPTPARVSRVDRSSCQVVGAAGSESVANWRPEIGTPAVGDWVALTDGEIQGIAMRVSALQRLDPGGETMQVLAANVDLVLVTAPADRLNLGRLERELVVAWDSGAQPIVVVTKGDIADPDDLGELEKRAVGVEVVVTSATTGLGFDRLRSVLAPHSTAVLLGPSGAGKSTLANRLLGSQALATGEVRGGDNRGRHTTTRRQLVVIPSGGVLIDTPGLRSLGLSGSAAGLEAAFSDLITLSEACRFSDCQHVDEPGCALRSAIDAGTLAPERLASYLKLRDENDSRDEAIDPKARKELREQAKAAAAESKAADRAARSAARRKS